MMNFIRISRLRQKMLTVHASKYSAGVKGVVARRVKHVPDLPAPVCRGFVGELPPTKADAGSP